MGYRDEQYAPLLGQKVIGVEGSTLYLENGGVYRFDLDGDCCSSSDFTAEGLAAFAELQGATIATIEDLDGESETPTKTAPDGDVLSWHFLFITTDKGHVTIDWRNDSNGYYDGSVQVAKLDALPPWQHDAMLLGRKGPE